jgi:hypothetical protein
MVGDKLCSASRQKYTPAIIPVSQRNPFQVPENRQRTTRLAAPRWQRDAKIFFVLAIPL